MSIHKVDLDACEIRELEQALEFMRKFHPRYWDRMSEDEICQMIQTCHALFKVNPALLAATNNSAILPVQ